MELGIDRLRIIAGALKGRRSTPRLGRACGRRPTGCARRCSTSWPRRVGEARVLDGYAGTGAVGIEALSRGAAHVTFVEPDPRAVRLIERTSQRCAVGDRYAIIRAGLRTRRARLPAGSFDLIFLDPPYGPDAMSSALEAAAPLVAPGGAAGHRARAAGRRAGPRRLPREHARRHVRRQRAELLSRRTPPEGGRPPMTASCLHGRVEIS